MALLWIADVNRDNIYDECIAKLVYEYIPTGKRNVGQPRKR